MFLAQSVRGSGEGETHSEIQRPTDGGAEDVRDADRQRLRVGEKGTGRGGQPENWQSL